MSITNDKIQKLKKEIEHIVFSDIGKADKVDKLWDFFTEHAKEVELRLYDKLFTEAQMGQIPEGEDYKNYLNPESLVLAKGYAEPALLDEPKTEK